MGKTANIIGATGLVGKELTNMLLKNDDYSLVRVFTRRETEMVHPKLEKKIIDFRKPELWSDLIVGDVLFSTLGTTIKQAGSQEAQYEVDFTFNHNFANAASINNVTSFVLVSSVGANANSSAFYTKMKGELDEAVSKLEFKNICLLRPSVLVGKRAENRMMEKVGIILGNLLTKIIFKKYKPIKAEVVAKAMINSVKDRSTKKVTIYTLDEISSLANR